MVIAATSCKGCTRILTTENFCPTCGLQNLSRDEGTTTEASVPLADVHFDRVGSRDRVSSIPIDNISLTSSIPPGDDDVIEPVNDDSSRGALYHVGLPGPRQAMFAAIFSVHEKFGAWHVPRRITIAGAFCGYTIDMRLADFFYPETEIMIVGLIGTINLIVPPGVYVTRRHCSIIGDVTVPHDADPRDSGPVLVLVGGSLLLTVTVEVDRSVNELLHIETSGSAANLHQV